MDAELVGSSDASCVNSGAGVIVFSEACRAAVLAAHEPDQLLDDAELKAMVEFVGQLCDAPIALVSIVEGRRQRFLARRGLEVTETPRSASFCQHAMVGEGVYEVRDASRNPLYADNPMVTGEPNIRFYAGAPLVSDEGMPLGALCAIDTVARPDGLTDLQREGLIVLSRAVMRRLNDRRVALSGKKAKEALADSRARFDALADAIPQMAWSTDRDGSVDYFNARWAEFTGSPIERHLGDGWVDALHPEDVEIAVAAWSQAVAEESPYEVEYRLRRHDGEYRWTLARGLPMKDESGAVIRWFGTNTDIHDRRLLEESRDLLSHELSHRIKNIFSVVAGLISFEARSLPSLKPMADSLRDRIQALGRAHDYVRPQGAGDSASRTLQGMLGELFAPYFSGDASRVTMRGDDFPVKELATTPLALVFHELATNAVKYGALATPDGNVMLNVSLEGGDVVIDWREHGGPARDGSGLPSFGSTLIDMSIERQLRGKITRGWDDGFVAMIRLPVASLG